MTLFPYTTLFRSRKSRDLRKEVTRPYCERLKWKTKQNVLDFSHGQPSNPIPKQGSTKEIESWDFLCMNWILLIPERSWSGKRGARLVVDQQLPYYPLTYRRFLLESKKWKARVTRFSSLSCFWLLSLFYFFVFCSPWSRPDPHAVSSFYLTWDLFLNDWLPALSIHNYLKDSWSALSLCNSPTFWLRFHYVIPCTDFFLNARAFYTQLVD